MKTLIFLITIACAIFAYAGTTITTTSAGLIFQNDGAVTKAQLDAASASIIAQVKASAVTCQPTNLTPVLTAIAALSTKLDSSASKSDIAAAVVELKAAIAAIPSSGTTTPPVTTPPPTSSQVGGIFIGTKEYRNLVDAGNEYKPGETIKITKSQDNQGTALVRGDVTVECDPGVKLTWSGGTALRVPWGKGVFNVEGLTKNFTIKNCDISGAVLDPGQGGNASAVRIVDGVDSATFINVNFHDNNNGILGAAKKTIVTNSKFSDNGAGPGQDGHTHNVYFSTYADELIVTDSYFGPTNIGNIFKSRAKKLVIDHCIFESKNTRDASYLIDIPNGGDIVVKNSVLLKATGQSQRALLSWGVEGLTADGRVNKYEFFHNNVVSDMTGNFMIATDEALPLINFHDNVLVGAFTGLVTQTNTKSFANRAQAGLDPAPALPPFLP